MLVYLNLFVLQAALFCIDGWHAPIEAEDCKLTKIITGKCTSVLKEALKLIEELLPHGAPHCFLTLLHEF